MEAVHRVQVVVVVERGVAVRPLHLTLPAAVQVAAFVGPVDQAQLAGGIAEPIDDHPEHGLGDRCASALGEATEQLVQAELLPQVVGDQGHAVLAHGPDLDVAELDAAQALRRGQLAQVLDESVDLVRGEILTLAEGAETPADDLAVDPDALHYVDVLVGVVGVVTAPDLDVHAPPRYPTTLRASTVDKFRPHAFQARNDPKTTRFEFSRYLRRVAQDRNLDEVEIAQRDPASSASPGTHEPARAPLRRREAKQPPR